MSTSVGGRSEERERKETEKLVVQLEADGQSQQLELTDIQPLDPSDTEGVKVRLKVLNQFAISNRGSLTLVIRLESKRGLW